MQTARRVKKGSGLRERKLPGTRLVIRVRLVYSLHHIFNKPNRLACYAKLPQIEWDSHQRAHLHERKVSGWRVSSVCTSLDEFAAIACFKRLNHDAGLLPICDHAGKE